MVDFAKTKGLSLEDATSLMIYWGIFGLLGKLSIGVCKTKKSTRIKLVPVLFATMSVLSWFFVLPIQMPIKQIFPICMSIYGICTGLSWTLLSICTADVYGAENVPLGVGWVYTLHAPASLIFFPLIGKVVDMSNGEYTLAFTMIGILCTLSTLSSYFFMHYAMKSSLIQKPQGTIIVADLELREMSDDEV